MEAWTPSSGDCATARVTGSLGGPAPYWQSWTFDDSDNRLSETTHQSAGDMVRSWTYPAIGAARPHAASQVSTRTGTATPSTFSLAYDAAGSVTSRRTLGGGVTGDTAGDQTLTWDREGRIATSVQGGKTVKFAWGAGNERLLRTDGTTTTLFLGSTELTWDGSKVSGYRSYTFAGATVAFRTGDSRAATTRTFSEVNGTTTVQVNDASGAISIQRTQPYGGPRGTTLASFNSTYGFVGGRNDPTLGMVHVGARDYDPHTGTFLSVDPVLDSGDPHQWNPYSYGGNDPINKPDPLGLKAPREFLEEADGSNTWTMTQSQADGHSEPSQEWWEVGVVPDVNAWAGESETRYPMGSGPDREYWWTVNYEAGEINSRAAQMRGDRAMSSIQGALACTYVRFGMLEFPDSAWDDKVVLGAMLEQQKSPDFKMNIPGTDYSYYYDIWGNISYGYIGRAAGFSRFELWLVPWLMGTSDPVDDDAVRLGMDLYERSPNGITPELLDQVVREKLSQERTNPQSAWFSSVQANPRWGDRHE